MTHFWNWLLDFTGVNYGQNGFATHMYNFWSGIGSDLTEFALIGALITVYREHVKSNKLLNTRMLEILHRKRDK